MLKAHSLGLEVDTRTTPVASFPTLIACFEFTNSVTERSEPHPVDDLSAMIGVRCTNRKVSVREPLSGLVRAKLAETVGTVAGCTVQLAEDPAQLAELAALCGDAERIRVVNPIGHTEFFRHELRWTPADAERTRDGLDLATMELSLMDTAGLRVASDPRAMDLIAVWRAGQGLARLSGRAIQAASAVALISVPMDTVSARLEGGRAVERLWMTANAEGWSVHPVSAPIFLTHALRFPMDGLRPHEREELDTIRERFQRLWQLGDRQPLFMVRLSRAGEPSARSLRLPVEELMVSLPAMIT